MAMRAWNFVEPELLKMSRGDRSLLLGYLVRKWKMEIPGHYPSFLSACYDPDFPLCNDLDLFSAEDRDRVINHLRNSLRR